MKLPDSRHEALQCQVTIFLLATWWWTDTSSSKYTFMLYRSTPLCKWQNSRWFVETGDSRWSSKTDSNAM